MSQAAAEAACDHMRSSGDKEVKIPVTLLIKFIDWACPTKDKPRFFVVMESSLDTIGMLRQHPDMIEHLGERAAIAKLIFGRKTLQDEETLEDVGFHGKGDEILALSLIHI